MEQVVSKSLLLVAPIPKVLNISPYCGVENANELLKNAKVRERSVHFGLVRNRVVKETVLPNGVLHDMKTVLS